LDSAPAASRRLRCSSLRIACVSPGYEVSPASLKFPPRWRARSSAPTPHPCYRAPARRFGPQLPRASRCALRLPHSHRRRPRWAWASGTLNGGKTLTASRSLHWRWRQPRHSRRSMQHARRVPMTVQASAQSNQWCCRLCSCLHHNCCPAASDGLFLYSALSGCWAADWRCGSASWHEAMHRRASRAAACGSHSRTTFLARRLALNSAAPPLHCRAYQWHAVVAKIHVITAHEHGG
jgi:hypothetical protein